MAMLNNQSVYTRFSGPVQTIEQPLSFLNQLGIQQKLWLTRSA